MDVPHILNTRGVAKRLGCTETWIHRLVSAGKLKAYIYDGDGMLVEHKLHEKRQGQGFYFLTSDIDAYRIQMQRSSKR